MWQPEIIIGFLILLKRYRSSKVKSAGSSCRVCYSMIGIVCNLIIPVQPFGSQKHRRRSGKKRQPHPAPSDYPKRKMRCYVYHLEPIIYYRSTFDSI